MAFKFNPFSGRLDIVAATSGAPLPVTDGGTGRATLTDGAVLVGNGTSPITMVGPLTDGQLLIGDTAGIDPVAATLTAPAAGITITGGAGSITFALADDLAAVEGLVTTGLATRTALNTWTTRTITGTSPIVVTNGDGVAGDPALTYINTPTVQGRLTLTTATPITTADVTAAATIYFTPYKGNKITIYDGSNWQFYSFTERSIAVPAVANQMYDVFIYDNAGTLTLELVAWTNDTTRATALTTQDGVYVKSGDATRLYLGSFRTITASQCNDSVVFRHLWNYYNRVTRSMRVVDGTNSWTYTTATFRQANANTANQLDYIQGLTEDPIYCTVKHVGSNSSGAVGMSSGIGIDSTSVQSAQLIHTAIGPASTNIETACSYTGYPGIGRHTLVWLEYSTATGTTTWLGDAGDATRWQTGISGTLLA